MEEILFNFWGAELREKQKAVKDSISLNKSERAIVEQHPNTQMLTDQMQSRLNEILNLIMTHRSSIELIKLFVQWSLDLFHDYTDRILTGSHTTLEQLDNLEYWEQEYLDALSSVFLNQSAQRRVFPPYDILPESEARRSNAIQLFHEIGDEVCRHIDRHIGKLKANSKPEPEQPKAEKWNTGKRLINFKTKIIDADKAQTIIEYLHPKFDGKKGKELAMAVQAAMNAKLILKPSFEELKSEFDIKGSKSAYYNKIDDCFPSDTLDAVIPINLKL